MRSKIVTHALIAGMSFAGAAFAATSHATGAIKALDAKALTVTLADGTTYHLPAGFKLGAFKVGEKVSIAWEAKGALHEATGMKAS
jgi:diphthamide biosynthesis methyltransferase